MWRLDKERFDDDRHRRNAKRMKEEAEALARGEKPLKDLHSSSALAGNPRAAGGNGVSSRTHPIDPSIQSEPIFEALTIDAFDSRPLCFSLPYLTMVDLARWAAFR